MGHPGGAFWRWADDGAPAWITRTRGYTRCPQNFVAFKMDDSGLDIVGVVKGVWKVVKDFVECLALVIGVRTGRHGQSEENVRRNAAIAAERRAERENLV